MRELGIGLVPFSAIGRGFLTGAFQKRDDLLPTDCRHAHPRFQEGNFEANLALLEPITVIAEAHGVTRGQVALAWLIVHLDGLVPVPGTARRMYLEEKLAAIDITLSTADLARLSATLPPGSVQGLRYPEFQLKKLGI